MVYLLNVNIITIVLSTSDYQCNAPEKQSAYFPAKDLQQVIEIIQINVTN